MDRSALDAAFFETLVTLNRKLRTVFDAHVREQGLTLSRARLIDRLSQSDGLTQTEISDILGIEQPSVVSLIDGMERKGLVVRRVDEADRRARRVYLTEAARAEAAALQDYVVELREGLLAGTDAADLQAAHRVLDRLLVNLVDIDAD